MKEHVWIVQRRAKDLWAGREIMIATEDSSWWPWYLGLRFFYWRWPHDFQLRAKDGQQWWIRGYPEIWRLLQKDKPNLVFKNRILDKLDNVRRKGYITGVGQVVRNLLSFFWVPKEGS